MNCLISLILGLSGVLLVVVTPAAAQIMPFENTLISTMNTHLPALLQGLSGAYHRSVAASSYILWSPTAFPVAVGADPNTPLPVVAAATPPSGGRVIVFGHENIPGGCCSPTNDGWDKLTRNAIHWLANGKTNNLRIASPPSLVWAAMGIAGVKATTSSLTIQTNVISLDNFTSAAGASAAVDIYWIDSTTNYTAAQVAALSSFIKQAGKGLLVAGQVASWGNARPGANIFTDMPINRVLWPLGLAVTMDSQTGLQAAPTSRPPATWPYFNSYYVAGLLAAARSGYMNFTDKGMYPTANAALNHLLKSLPLRSASDASGLTSLWSLLESARTLSGSQGVGPKKPLDPRNAYPGDVLDVNIEVWMNRRGDTTGLRASRSARAYPGVPPAAAPRVTLSLIVNATYNRPPYRFFYAGWSEPVWRTTGLYAAPGELVTVTVRQPSAFNKGLMVQVGSHTDDLTVKEQWFRVPYAVSRVPITRDVTMAGNPLGGPVYILVPKGLNLSNINITISNAIRMPVFRLGTTDMTDWTNTIRSYPAPWGELNSGKLILMMPSICLRNLTNPVPLLSHWNRVMDAMAWLANMPAERAREERFLVDADIGGGWMHSGYPIMGHDDPSTYREVTDLAQLQAMGAWGTYHELGHNHQWGPMQFSGSLESFNNLWTIYALEQTGVSPVKWLVWQYVSPDGRAKLRSEYFAKGPNWARDWSNYVALDTYLQLKDAFGWGFYRKLYEVYGRKPLQLPDDEVQTWIQTSSSVAGFNLVPFYAKWGFPATQKTLSVCASLPPWAANPLK